jgi:putative transposase
MKKSKFNESQIVTILKQQDAGMSVNDICRENGISQPTFYAWKKKYSGMVVSDLKRLKELELENSKLKRMYADVSLQRDALKDLIEKKF